MLTVAGKLNTLVAESDPDLPLALAQAGEELEQELSEADKVRTVCHAIVSIAEELKCQSLAGASRVGERLAGAAVALADNGLRVYSPPHGSKREERVLIVDGLFVTGAQLARQAQVVIRSGGEAYGAVVLAVPGASAPPGVQDLRVIS